MRKDQLFKELLRQFFQEFIELFLPEIAARLDFDRVRFLDTEAFTDFPDAARRDADLLAEVYTKNGDPEFILFHTEVQAKRTGEFPYRMWEYYAVLRLRHKRPVFPVVIYLAPGAGGVTIEHYTESLFDWEILRFNYRALGLPDLNASDWKDKGGALSAALSVAMKAKGQSRVRRQFEATKSVVQSSMNEAKQFLLVQVIQTFLPLNPQEEQELRTMLKTKEAKDVEEFVETWADRARALGIKQGVEQGIQEGLLQGQRNAALKLMRVRFGELPEPVVAQVEGVTDTAVLDSLLEQMLTAKTLEDIVLPPLDVP